MKVSLAQINPKIAAFSENTVLFEGALRQAQAEGAHLLVFPELALCGYPPLDLLQEGWFPSEILNFLKIWVEAAGRALTADPSGALEAVVFGAPLPVRPPAQTVPHGGLSGSSGASVHGAQSGSVPFDDTPLFYANAALCVQRDDTAGDGWSWFWIPKSLLPTYDVFDEDRYFIDGPRLRREGWQSVDFGCGSSRVPLSENRWPRPMAGRRWGVLVCEDSWYHARPWDYPQGDPVAGLAGQVDGLINLSASPFSWTKAQERRQMVQRNLEVSGASVFVYVNCVGAQDGLLFDGESGVFFPGEGESGAPVFSQGLFTFDLELPSQPQFGAGKGGTSSMGSQHSGEGKGSGTSGISRGESPRVGLPQKQQEQQDKRLQRVHDGLVVGIRDYFQKTGFSQAILGLSGGLDSALVAVLAARALGADRVWGFSLPSSFSSQHSLDDAAQLAQNLGVHYDVIPIRFLFTNVLRDLKGAFAGAPEDVTEENIQSRLRGLLLMSVANKKNGLMLSTGNRSELAMGYATLYGDLCGALAPLGDLYKTEVYALARWINSQAGRDLIPRSTLEKPPSAELRPDQKDEDSLPPYDRLDSMLSWLLEERALPLSPSSLETTRGDPQWDRVKRAVPRQEFKRQQAPLILRVRERAFGRGRRVPVVRG